MLTPTHQHMARLLAAQNLLQTRAPTSVSLCARNPKIPLCTVSGRCTEALMFEVERRVGALVSPRTPRTTGARVTETTPPRREDTPRSAPHTRASSYNTPRLVLKLLPRPLEDLSSTSANASEAGQWIMTTPRWILLFVSLSSLPTTLFLCHPLFPLPAMLRHYSPRVRIPSQLALSMTETIKIRTIIIITIITSTTITVNLVLETTYSHLLPLTSLLTFPTLPHHPGIHLILAVIVEVAMEAVRV